MRIIKQIFIILFCIVLLTTPLVLYWITRSNTSEMYPGLTVNIREIINDGMNNCSTDLIYWKGKYYLTYVSTQSRTNPKKNKIILKKSSDLKKWELLKEIKIKDSIIDKPKFAPLPNKLILMFHKSIFFDQEFYNTACIYSTDGRNWSALQDIIPKGWLFWRPKSSDGINWYAAAHWHKYGKSMLFKSTDGIKWTEVSLIYKGERVGETAIEMNPDGKLISISRINVSPSRLGHKNSCTLISISQPPYKKWEQAKSYVTRLDGPDLFSFGGKVYAAGRNHANPATYLNRIGSIFGKKRTSLYLVADDKLIYLTDLPSSGDTSYPGSVIRNNKLYLTYYTNSTKKDYPWLIGMKFPSAIKIAEISMPSLSKLSQKKLSEE